MSRNRRSRSEILPVRADKTSLPAPSEAELQEQAAAGLLMSAKVTRGPLPTPDTLAGYEEVLPGLAERIVVRFEKEAERRHERERFEEEQYAKQIDAQVRQIDARIKDDRLKLLFSYLTALGLIVVAAVLAWQGHPFYATALVAGGGGAIGTARWLLARSQKDLPPSPEKPLSRRDPE